MSRDPESATHRSQGSRREPKRGHREGVRTCRRIQVCIYFGLVLPACLLSQHSCTPKRFPIAGYASVAGPLVQWCRLSVLTPRTALLRKKRVTERYETSSQTKTARSSSAQRFKRAPAAMGQGGTGQGSRLPSLEAKDKNKPGYRIGNAIFPGVRILHVFAGSDPGLKQGTYNQSPRIDVKRLGRPYRMVKKIVNVARVKPMLFQPRA